MPNASAAYPRLRVGVRCIYPAAHDSRRGLGWIIIKKGGQVHLRARHTCEVAFAGDAREANDLRRILLSDTRVTDRIAALMFVQQDVAGANFRAFAEHYIGPV